MALPSTLHRFELDISDVDRGVYERVEFRLVRHPSESVAYALVRVLAYALEYSESLQFGPGLCDADEPALSAPDGQGGIAVWIDVGGPSGDRLHKATKKAESVVVYTHRDLAALQKDWTSRAIHRGETIRVISVRGPLLDALEPTFDRTNVWGLVRTDGTLYVTVGDETFSGAIRECGITGDDG